MCYLAGYYNRILKLKENVVGDLIFGKIKVSDRPRYFAPRTRHWRVARGVVHYTPISTLTTQFYEHLKGYAKYIYEMVR